MNKFLEFKTFQEAFLRINDLIINNPEYQQGSRIGDVNEITSFSYSVDDLSSFEFERKDLGRIDYEYSNTFYEWMISGSTDTEEAFKEYPNVAKFISKPENSLLPANFNTFYGPRIVAQLPKVIQELTKFPNTRRAVISILKDTDLDLLGTDEKLEFPCCDSATLTIRENKLNIHVHMRSQNMGQVLKLDMYLWGRFACELAEKLSIEPGKFSSSVVSAHVFKKDFEYLNSLIND